MRDTPSELGVSLLQSGSSVQIEREIMSKAQVQQAVILAAGFGSRIRSNEEAAPKPLISLGGLSLLKRSLLTAHKGGISRFAIILGFQGERIRQALEGDPELEHLELIWVENEQYQLANGISVLKAQPHMEGEFFLMMADHVIDAAIIQKLQEEEPAEGLILAVDRKLDSIFDMDDATKVKTGPGERILEIGKQLEEFDAVDTGVFRCSPALFEALITTFEERGAASLSDGVQALADIGAAWWQDVDDEPSRKHAEALLFKSLTKTIDGPISRHINRRFSKSITRLVMNRDVLPNHMTALGLLIGLASAAVTVFATTDSLWFLALGGLLYQLSSMIDGCDGELARLKFKHSDLGEWFDTVSDDVINLSYQLALGYALFQITGNMLWLHLSIATFILGWVLAGSLYRKLIAVGKGTHLAFNWNIQTGAEASLSQRFIARFEFVAHRDFYALALMLLSFIGVVALQFALSLSLLVVSITAAQWISMNLNRSSDRQETRTVA